MSGMIKRIKEHAGDESVKLSPRARIAREKIRYFAIYFRG
jgi:hypothetical protein